MILVLGIIQMVLAGLTLLLTLFGALSMARLSSERAPAGGMAFAMLFYLIPAANLATTGIASVRFRPWARLATIISAAIWLGFSALGLVGILVSVLATRSHVGVAELFMMLVAMGPILFGLPITLIVLYTREGVRETFARRYAERERP